MVSLELEFVLACVPGVASRWALCCRSSVACGFCFFHACFFCATFLFVAAFACFVWAKNSGLFVPQIVFFAGLSFDQLLLPNNEKGFEYALWPILTVVPSGIFTWIEAIGCTTSPLMKDHGHVIYDVYMTTSYIFFYVLCWMRSTRLSIRKVK